MMLLMYFCHRPDWRCQMLFVFATCLFLGSASINVFVLSVNVFVRFTGL